MTDRTPESPASRRAFLQSLGVAAGAALPVAGTVAAPAPSRPDTSSTIAPGPAYLTAEEMRFVEAAVATLIPADELGPGALEAGVADYIDRQLASPWGVHARHYRQGPWGEGAPQQGYQLPLTPQQLYRAAIAETNRDCLRHRGRGFDALDRAAREEVLTALEADAIALEAVPARTFFSMLWENTIEGFFADPRYGGNRDKIGWRLIGFPGVAAAYGGLLERHNEPYRVSPVSIDDVRARLVPTDAHGHPKHVPEPPSRETSR
ncbi:MAG: gluconate 2-dehydrogenase subunit 3 family protein [Proteobacteria bacterium]|nr:gluconate 2-dehydrogenase subunit 3 family protein [Pseudomonadota bacterium]